MGEEGKIGHYWQAREEVSWWVGAYVRRPREEEEEEEALCTRDWPPGPKLLFSFLGCVQYMYDDAL